MLNRNADRAVQLVGNCGDRANGLAENDLGYRRRVSRALSGEAIVGRRCHSECYDGATALDLTRHHGKSVLH